MCGILGIAQSNQSLDLPNYVRGCAWQRGMERLQPRGPDDSGVWVCSSGHAAFGHTRLSIQDLSASGHQPMLNEDGTIVVTYNGEIYNAPVLRNELLAAGHTFKSSSDTEVLVHGYEQWGIEHLLQKIIGMYAFAVWDVSAKLFFAAVDHVSIKPLAWTYFHNTLYFGTDCDAVRAIAPFIDTLNPNALCHVLCHGHVPQPDTLWKGMFKLEPGTFLSWKPGSHPVVNTHWSPPEYCESVNGGQEEFEELWRTVVSDHLLADVEVGLLLSGGFDSTSILAALAESGESLSATTLSMAGADEAPVARLAAQHFNSEHCVIALEESGLDAVLEEYSDIYDEPLSYSALLTMIEVSRAARTRHKVVLAGDGGDEAFAGYNWHRREPLQRPQKSNCLTDIESKISRPSASAKERKAAMADLREHSFLTEYLQMVLPRFHPCEANTLFAPVGSDYSIDAYLEPVKEYDCAELPWPRRAQRIDLLSFCAGVVNPKIDRATMAYGLELRVPFLDKRILEWAFHQAVTPEELASNRGKLPLSRYLQGRVPDALFKHPKQGFSLRLTENVWLRYFDWLKNSKMVRYGYIHPEWERFIAQDVDFRAAKISSLLMIARVLEKRL